MNHIAEAGARQEFVLAHLIRDGADDPLVVVGKTIEIERLDEALLSSLAT